MMFTCCHPALSPDAQVVLILKTLCGLQIPEIARAFLSTEENIHKRLVRARQKIRAEQVAFQVPEGAALRDRLAAVLDAIYLLFNEGYSASKGDALIRYDLCAEAIRLAELAAGHPVLQHEPSIAALCALMYLNAARFPAREDADGRSIPLDEQDRSLWDAALMEKGFFYLRQSRSPGQASRFHWLAAISACHCAARSYADTDWKRILNLYDGLQELDASPLVVLNRAVAVERVSGAAAALTELEKIKNDPALRSYYLFYAAQGTFYLQAAAFQEAALAFSQAIELAPREAERQFFQKKLDIARQSED